MSVAIFAGCSKDDNTWKGDTSNYIDSPLLPMSKMTWEMLRPENGGSVPGYSYDPVLSKSYGTNYYSDVFVNETDKKAWRINYANIYDDGIPRLESMWHYYYSQDAGEINSYKNYLSNIFKISIGSQIIGKSTKNSHIEINPHGIRYETINASIAIEMNALIGDEE